MSMMTTQHICSECGRSYSSEVLAESCCTCQSSFSPVEIGDFIRIPAWTVEGQVTAVLPASLGSEDAIEVLLQCRSDGPECRYRLEPNEYEVIS